jgi:hypothetical protein
LDAWKIEPMDSVANLISHLRTESWTNDCDAITDPMAIRFSMAWVRQNEDALAPSSRPSLLVIRTVKIFRRQLQLYWLVLR